MSKDTELLRRYLQIINEATEIIAEKWGVSGAVNPAERGKYAGKSKAELLKQYNALKKSGPHPRGSKEYGRMRELSFAIRAKSGWGKVGESDYRSE
jgi:hypothetical protein